MKIMEKNKNEEKLFKGAFARANLVSVGKKVWP